MIKKQLIQAMPESKKYIAGNVIFQWLALVSNIVLMTIITTFIAGLIDGGSGIGKYNFSSMAAMVISLIVCVIVRAVCNIGSSKMSYLSSKTVKRNLRQMIYEKLLRMGASYNEKVKTSELVQVTVEGVDQLETYFGAYMPQFFYAMLAPLTLFVYICTINVVSAVVLLICVPLIPISIAFVQTWAKKLLSKYWSQYTALGDTFLENLEGLTTLKIYQADDYKNIQMNEESEKFRKITMKVLTMQLNSITIMDFVAYGGAALGIILSVTQFRAGNINLAGCLLIILLSADFFIPMRQLGSFFHIAMNGMAASDKIFNFLALEEEDKGSNEFPANENIELKNVHFSYEKDREILKGVDMTFSDKSFTAIVGESGCGKSTLAGILMHRNKGYTGDIRIGSEKLSDIREASLMQNVTYISHQSNLFKGTIRDNLIVAYPEATDEHMLDVLKRVNLYDFVMSEGGLDMKLNEQASNLSGGQRQRLALARALMHDRKIYIFDEATSNIDMESEDDIMREVLNLAKTKTVILISHRLANVVNADNIYVLEAGRVAEAGKHNELLAKNGVYSRLWNVQYELENYGFKDDVEKRTSGNEA